MLTPNKIKLISIKNHVHRNRGKYAALTVMTIMLALQYSASKQWTEFLVEKGIDPLEFFNPEYFAELNS